MCKVLGAWEISFSQKISMWWKHITAPEVAFKFIKDNQAPFSKKPDPIASLQCVKATEVDEKEGDGPVLEGMGYTNKDSKYCITKSIQPWWIKSMFQ